MKRKIVFGMAMTAVLLFAGCAGRSNADSHMTATEGVVFDRELAEQFEAPNCLIVEAGEEIVIE